MRLIQIKFSDNQIKTFDMETLSIEDMNNLINSGCEVIKYINYKMEV